MALERFGLRGATPLLAYEHAHRYALAATVVRGQRVLDLASGTGYGSRLLRESGGLVTALDCDFLAVRQAGAGAVVGRAESLPFRAEAFDAVTCFEAIEHVRDCSRILDEIARVLAPDGFALLSTPDRRLYTERWGQRNPYHLHELDYDELLHALRSRFGLVSLYGQSVWAGSWISELDEAGTPGGKGPRRIRVLEAPECLGETAPAAPWTSSSEAGFPAALYLVAACTRSESRGLRLSRTLGRDSLLHDRRQALLGHALATGEAVVERNREVESQSRHARELGLRIDALEQHVTNLRHSLEERSDHCDGLTGLLSEARARSESLEQHASNLEGALEERTQHADNLSGLLSEARARSESLEQHASNLEGALEERTQHADNLSALLSEARARSGELERHVSNLEALLIERSRHAENLKQLAAQQCERAALLADERDLLARNLEEARATVARIRNATVVRWLRHLRLLE